MSGTHFSDFRLSGELIRTFKPALCLPYIGFLGLANPLLKVHMIIDLVQFQICTLSMSKFEIAPTIYSATKSSVIKLMAFYTTYELPWWSLFL